jgi:hypothetical protein
MAKIICYDLQNETEKNGGQLIRAIKKIYPSCCMITETCWIVSTLDNSIQIADKLSSYVDSKDKLFVGMLIPGFYNACWTKTMSENQQLNYLLDCY